MMKHLYLYRISIYICNCFWCSFRIKEACDVMLRTVQQKGCATGKRRPCLVMHLCICIWFVFAFIFVFDAVSREACDVMRKAAGWAKGRPCDPTLAFGHPRPPPRYQSGKIDIFAGKVYKYAAAQKYENFQDRNNLVVGGKYIMVEWECKLWVENSICWQPSPANWFEFTFISHLIFHTRMRRRKSIVFSTNVCRCNLWGQQGWSPGF